ncbi:MAG: thiamine phosphate synthase [Phycisphaerae bacterium]|nr:thiamine phosphate synthase [Phycisphaerae bacterium]
MREVYRILDANFNRAREALRVVEDCGRFALNDPAITAMAKHMRSDLKDVLAEMPADEMVTSRDTPGDIGTELTSPSEPTRSDLSDVARAACKRLSEALRTIEEYSKFVSPEKVRTLERMRYDGYTLEQRVTGRLLVRTRFADVRLYLLISGVAAGGSVRQLARAAIAGGADALQLRERGLPDAMLLAVAAELRELTDEMGRMLIINDRPDIAAIVGADGVHLGQQDLPIAEARRLLRPGALVGRSTHSVAQAQAAVTEGADYLGVGPVFRTDTKDAGEPQGPQLYRAVADAVGDVPLVPIGGINAENVSDLVDAGAVRVAVSSAVCAADDPKAAARTIRKQLPAPQAPDA